MGNNTNIRYLSVIVLATALVCAFFLTLTHSSALSVTNSPVNLEFDPETNSLAVTTDKASDQTKSPYHLYYTNEEKIELVRGKLEEKETEIELKTCSGEDCTDHNVTKGVIKIEAAENVKTRYFVISEETLNSQVGKTTRSLDITEKEQAWLESKSFSFPVTQLSAIVPFSPVPTISFLPNISIQSVDESFSVFNNGLLSPASLPSVPEGTIFSGVKDFQKISDTEGNFSGNLNSVDYFGYSLAQIGDVNGDSITDIAVGTPWDDDGGSEKGAIYILFLNANGTVKSHQKISDIQGNLSALLDNNDQFGWSVSQLGDLNNDSVPDIAVGGYGDDDGGSEKGAIYILFLNSDGTVKSHQKISDTQGNFSGNLDDFNFFGASVSELGDLNNDSVPDIAVGAFADNDGGFERGAIYILFGSRLDKIKKLTTISYS